MMGTWLVVIGFVVTVAGIGLVVVGVRKVLRSRRDSPRLGT